MSEDADHQGKNFRSSYYDSLVFRGEEKNVGCLESLLKAESLDLEELRKFCQKHTLPPYYRLQVWKLVLGVVPPYNDEETSSYVQLQRRQQFDDLNRALRVVLGPSPLAPHIKVQAVSTETGDASSELVFMYLLENNLLPTTATVSSARDEHHDLFALGSAFVELCDEQVDAYFLLSRFVKKLDGIDQGQLKAGCFQYLEGEDSVLCAHMKTLSSGIPFTLWFNQCFASALPEYCLESVWDRLIGGCVMILVFMAVAILLTFKRRLLGAKTAGTVKEVLTQIPEENCGLIVNKAVQLWETHGSPLLPTVPSRTI